MPRTEEANQRIREEQSAKILDGARKVFARKGMAATMADVAAAAEVSQGLAYRYFANKEEIFHTLMEQMIQSGSSGVQRILEMPGTPSERLDFMISMILKGRHEHPEFYLLLYQGWSDEAVPDNIRELIVRQGQTFQDAMRQLFVEGQASGEVAEGDPDQMVTVISACLDGLTRLALYDPEQFNKNVPDARIVLRLLKPDSDQK